MAAGPGRPLLVLLAILLAAAALAAAIGWALGAGLLPDSSLAQDAAALVPTLLLGAGAALVLYLVARAVARALRARGGSPSAARPLETVAAVAVALVVTAVATSSAGTAVLSLGLVGFGLTLALQRPLLAMAGWAAIRFGGLFREGDRIEVRGIVGDVLEVTLFTTRLWEIGSDASPLPWGGAVSPLRPTGRVVVLSNATFLEEPVANATTHLPFVFDEFAVGVAYEADWRFAEAELRRVAAATIDAGIHERAARDYERLVADLPASAAFPREPVVLVSLETSWIELRLRYLVDVRNRSATRSALARGWQEAADAAPDRLPNVYPRTQPMAVGGDGRPR